MMVPQMSICSTNMQSRSVSARPPVAAPFTTRVRHASTTANCAPSDQGGQWIPGADFQGKHGRNRARHQSGIAERRQIDQPNAVRISADHPLGDGETDRALANAAGHGNRHQALARELCDNRCRGFFAANHPGCRNGRLCGTAGATARGDEACNGYSPRIGATKL
jgi:hypothetical protein